MVYRQFGDSNSQWPKKYFQKVPVEKLIDGGRASFGKCQGQARKRLSEPKPLIKKLIQIYKISFCENRILAILTKIGSLFKGTVFHKFPIFWPALNLLLLILTFPPLHPKFYY